MIQANASARERRALGPTKPPTNGACAAVPRGTFPSGGFHVQRKRSARRFDASSPAGRRLAGVATRRRRCWRTRRPFAQALDWREPPRTIRRRMRPRRPRSPSSAALALEPAPSAPPSATHGTERRCGASGLRTQTAATPAELHKMPRRPQHGALQHRGATAFGQVRDRPDGEGLRHGGGSGPSTPRGADPEAVTGPRAPAARRPRQPGAAVG